MENEPKIVTQVSIEDINNLLEDQVARRILVKESHYIFFHFYFSQYTKYKTAPFQKEMFKITEDPNIRMAVIVAFRGSAKSTIMTMSYPIWAILGKQQKKCVVILSQTQQQAKIHLANIKRELESNELLRKDLGPFQESSDEWGSFSLVIPNFNAKIVAASSEQSIRGLRHGAYRPDLIICDDVEDLTSTKTKESRDRTYSWFTGEIVPLGEKDTRIIMVGNLLHEDSLLMRLRKNILEDSSNALYREYPVVNDRDEILWKGRYPTMLDLEIEKKLNGDDKAWQREYMLKIIADEDQIVRREWIQYYDEIPIDRNDHRHTLIGVDLAISSSNYADYTAIVVGHVFGNEETLRIYIEAFPVNQRLDFPSATDKIKEVARVAEKYHRHPKVYIEDVGYQRAVIQQLVRQNVSAEGFPVNGQDKRARLDSVTHMIRSGKVLFPKKGTEDLIQQLVYFGVEKHDDLVDA
ncbi:MAG TPA: hypothetical protein PKI16_03275, partial [Candidatus Dojkabacteria bacterium]|nr:hypothetical protein [Candidatus Dojkabacteria bacterium]